MASENFSPYATALKTYYNTMGPSYNAITKTMHALGPNQLIEAAGPTTIRPGASVLDLATGTGKIALAAAAKVGAEGHVLGIDVSDGFLDIARETAENAGVGERVEFLQRDVKALDLPTGKTYEGRWADAVTCGNAIAMFDAPGELLDTLAREVLKPGGVFVADMWAVNLVAKIFLDVAVPRGFVAPFDPAWLADTEGSFRRVFEGREIKLSKLEVVGENTGRWDVGSEEKVEKLWSSISVEQTWLSFGLDTMDPDTVEEIKQAWIKEIEVFKNKEGIVATPMKHWIAVGVAKE